MQTYKTIIIDDEENSRSNTKAMLAAYCPEIEVIAEGASGMEGKKLIQDLKPHVVFCDINMPGMTGLEMIDGLAHRDFCLIFLTAYSEHGINAVKAGAIDYLLKPLLLKELQDAVKKVVHHYEQKGIPANTAAVDKNLVLINHSKGFTLIDYKDIVWLEASDNYTNIYLSNNNNKKIVASKTLKEFEAILPTNVFFRIHRSSLINIDYIKEYSNAEGGTILMSDGTSIQVSKARSQEFAEFLKTRAVTPK
jgi:two-component system LytT family response regulator